MSIEELAALYAAATVAAEIAVDAANTSWGEILEKINKIPSSVETTVKIKEIRQLIDAIGDKAGIGGEGGTKVDATTAALEAAVTAAEATSASATKSLSLSRSNYADAVWRSNWRELDPLEAEIDRKEKELKEANDKLAAAKKALADQIAKDALYDPNDPSHKGSYADGLKAFPGAKSMGSYGAIYLKELGYWAKGGFIPKGTDTVPAMLTPGEFVINRAAVDKYGLNYLKNLNAKKIKAKKNVIPQGINIPMQNNTIAPWKKPQVEYDNSGNPTGSPTGRYWGELERLYQQSPLGFDNKNKPIFNNTGKDPWGGTEIPGLKFTGPTPQFSDYLHQLAEQPPKPTSGAPAKLIDERSFPIVGSGASMGGIGGGLYRAGAWNTFASGGIARGTDIVPAMLTPGEFVMSKYAVESQGMEKMKAINNGSSVGDSVYNYNLNVNVKSDANPDDIARAVMVQIKSVDAQRIRGTRI
jgi:hypothetical protein